MKRPGFDSVKDYIGAQSSEGRRALSSVRRTILKALPGATEGISYQIPVYKLDGVMVLYFAGFARHYSIYPATAHLVSALRKELSGHLRKKTIRFPIDAPVPTRLVTRIAKLRAEEAILHALTKSKKKASPKAKGKPKSSSVKKRRTRS
jgi:uncharacterized protein YdhG (YjbR/CyaY superfamily)